MNASKVGRLLFTVVVGIMLSCCSQKPAKEKIIGRWVLPESFYEFKGDGKVNGLDLNSRPLTGTYKVEAEHKVTITRITYDSDGSEIHTDETYDIEFDGQNSLLIKQTAPEAAQEADKYQRKQAR